MTRALALQTLTADAFAPFGTLLDLDPQGGPGRFDRRADLLDRRGGLAPNLALVRAKGERLPQAIVRMERHPHSSQAFVPMGMAGRFFVCVTEDLEGRPDPSRLRAFTCEGARGIVYAPGVWHHPLLSLIPCRFLMLVHEDGGAEDTEWADLPVPVPLAAQA